MGPEPPLDNSFYRKILDLENRLSGLQQAPPGYRDQLLDVALEELKSSLEEMHVAHEELQSQNAELEAARYSLEEEHQRYQELFDLAPDGYLVTTTEGVIKEANQALCSLLGRSSEFLSGKPLLVFIAPENRRDFSFQLHRLGQHQGAAEFESRLQTREGDAFFARFAVNPARDPRGQRIGLRWLVHDSTQRNRLEAWRIRQRLAELSRISRSITTTMELPAVLQEIVSGACQLIGARYGAVGVFNSSGEIEQFVTYGLSQEERHRIGSLPAGKGMLGWLHQQQQPIRLADLSQHPQSVGFPPHHPPMKAFLGVPARFDHQVLANLYLTEKEDGQEFTQDDEDLVVLFAAQASLAINNTITYQGERAARAQLEAERQRLTALMDTSPVGILACDIDGRVTLVNREAERILGFAHQADFSLEKYEQAAVYRRPDESPYPIQDLPLQRALYRGDTVLGEEVRFEFTDDRAVLMAVSSRPLYGPDGKQTGAITVFQDISVLEETERLRSQFLGMVSHELRTPITAIKGAAASILGSRHAPDHLETMEFFQIVNEQADHLTSLVNNLMDLTRIEAGTLSVNPQPASLRAIIDEAVSAFGKYGNTHEVQINTPEGLPTVLADRRRIVEVLTNLLSNAAKFSPRLTAIVIQVEHGPTHVSVMVQDSGLGFPQEASSQLFQKFSQIHRDSDRGSGTGLGLAICKGIVEAHGGRIWADSPGPGQGSTFTFTLPLAPEAPGEPSGFTDWKPASAGLVRHTGQRARILAVDDDPHVLRYLRRLLDEANYEINVVDNPREVIRLVELEMPELILLDLKFPDANGLDLLRQLRELSNVPVIFLTAQDDNQTVVSALRAGADDYITKPFSGSELLARVDTVLNRRSDSGPDNTLPTLVLDNLRVDLAQRKVTVLEQEVTLTATEYNLLHCLAIHAGRVMTHDQLLQRVWGDEYSGDTEIVRSMIRNLRAKLGDNGRSPKLILTHPGVGYSMPKP